MGIGMFCLTSYTYRHLWILLGMASKKWDGSWVETVVIVWGPWMELKDGQVMFCLVALGLMIGWVVWMTMRLFRILYNIASLILDILTSRVSSQSFASISVTLAILWYTSVTQQAAQCCIHSSLLISRCVWGLWCRCRAVCHLWSHQGLVGYNTGLIGGSGDSSSDEDES